MSHEVQVIGFKSVPPYAQSLVEALGLAAINWGKLEQQLDMLLLAVNRPEYARAKFRETPNTSFKMKIELFEKWYVKDPRFKNVASRAKLLVPTLRKVSADRQMLFHSNVQEFVDGNPPSIRTLHLRAKGEDVTLSKGNWTEKQIRYFAESVARFSEGMATISQETMNERFRQSLEIVEPQTQTGTGLAHHTKRIVCALARRLGLGTCQ
jgi:hypothetical protein